MSHKVDGLTDWQWTSALRLAITLLAISGTLFVSCVEKAESPDSHVAQPGRSVKTQPITPPSAKPPIADVVLPEFTLLEEEVYDAPVKTQISASLLVTGEITADGLKLLLEQQYNEIMARTDFEHHNSPTSAYIWAYTSEDLYKSGMGQWVAMIQKAHADEKPTTTISEERLAQLDAEPEERFGFTEEERIAIFQSLVRAQDRGLEEAMSKYPEPDDWGKQIDLERQLVAKYEQAVCTEYGLTSEQLAEIAVEGLQKNWPFPASDNK